MCASTSSAAAESAAVAEGSAPGRLLCSNFQEAPATSKSTAASTHTDATEKPNRMIHPRFVWMESVVDLATEKGNNSLRERKELPHAAYFLSSYQPKILQRQRALGQQIGGESFFSSLPTHSVNHGHPIAFKLTLPTPQQCLDQKSRLSDSSKSCEGHVRPFCQRNGGQETSHPLRTP